MITRESTIDKIFSDFPHKAPRLAQVMSNAGLHCAGCNASTSETLEAGMYGHGFEDEAIEELVRQLNAVLEEVNPPSNTITLTRRAAEKYLSILREEGKIGWGIRLAEQAGGCNGFEYVLDYSEKARPEDVLFVSEGIEIHVPKNMAEHLLGAEIDFVDGLRGSGFKISNPNVRSCCGCGSSHGY